MAKSDARTARASREASDRRKAEALAKGERIDPALLQQFIKTSTSVASLTESLKAAEGAAGFVMNEIREQHKMNDGDGFDPKTGIIVRQKPSR